MPAKIDIKLQDLAKIALGTPELTRVNIALLQSLIEILLKKLNCENETVSLNVCEAAQLENLLKSAKASPVVFDDENVENVSEKLARLNKLQESVGRIDEKLNGHLEEMQRTSNFNETAIDWENWPSYGCEHLCTVCDPENEMACTLLRNTDFIKKLLRRLSAPIIDRMFCFEENIQQLNEEFTKFIKRTKEEYLKINLLEKSIEEIEEVRRITQEQHKQFLHTMEEIQDMLDSKLDKIHIPALKKFIRDNFAQIDKSIYTLQDKQNCPRAAGIIMGGIRCLSCGAGKVCSDVNVQPPCIMQDVQAKQEKFCGKLHGHKNPKRLAMESLNLRDVVIIRQSETIGKGLEKNALPKCNEGAKDLKFLKGTDGKLYRAG